MLAFASDAGVGVFTAADFINVFPPDNKSVTRPSDLLVTVIAVGVVPQVRFPSWRISREPNDGAGNSVQTPRWRMADSSCRRDSETAGDDLSEMVFKTKN